MTKKLSLFLSVLILSFAFGYFIFAWTEPTQSPPGGDVPTPINVGSTAQTKTGNLTLPSLYLGAGGSEGNIYNADIVQGYNDLRLWGNSARTATIYLDGPANVTGNLTVGGNATVSGQNVCRQDGTYCPAFSTDCVSCDSRFVNVSGDTMSGGLGLANNNIDSINNLFIADPGASEGISWNGTAGGWKIDVSPSNRSNADGDLNLYGTANNIHLWRPTQINGNLTVSGNATVSGQNVCRQDGTYCPAFSTDCVSCDSRFINVGESGDSIADNTIDSSEIQDNTLTASDLAANSCGNSELIDSPTFTNLTVNGAIIAPEGTLRDDGGGWLRTYGNTGWYSQTYGGGWYMYDTTWIRAYNNKSVYTGGEMRAGTVRGNTNVCIGSDCRSSWPSGADGYNPNNQPGYGVRGEPTRDEIESWGDRYDSYNSNNQPGYGVRGEPTRNEIESWGDRYDDVGITSESDTLDSVCRRGKRTDVHPEIGRIYDLNTSYWIDMDGESRLNVVKVKGELDMEGRSIKDGYLNHGGCYDMNIGYNGNWRCPNGYYMAGVRIDSWGQGISTGALYCCKL